MSTRVGVISDTHGRLDADIAGIFEGVDHIIHAGDIGDEAILYELRAIAPLTAVAGNIDGFVCGDAGVAARAEIGGLSFLVTHIIDRPRRLTAEVAAVVADERPDVVVFGHSHLPHDEIVGGTLFFNPASAGPRRFDYPRSVGIIEIASRRARGRHVPLDAPSGAALDRYMNALSRREP
ncbi:MAG: metallophosphoesterase family protein [Thermoanaerobaculia bacterium]